MNDIYSHPGKSLKDHLREVAEISKKITEEIPLNLPFDAEVLKGVAYLIGFYHDIGKATSFFQEYLLEENQDKKKRLRNLPETKHSLLSSIASYYAVEEFLNQLDFKYPWRELLLTSSFLAVRRHHSDLENFLDDLKFEDSLEVLKRQIKKLDFEYLSFLPFWQEVKSKLLSFENLPLRKMSLIQILRSMNDVLPYIIHQFLYSTLLDSDKHHTVLGELPKRIEIPFDIVEIYRQFKGFENATDEVNKLRNEIYYSVLKKIEDLNLDRCKILSLSAPTGSGKTQTSLAFALNLRDRIQREKNFTPRIIYSLPFLSIIDQNAKVIEEIFKVATGNLPTTDLFLVHHHLSDYKFRKNEVEYDIDESEILIEGWNSELIITTFVQLFHTIFSNRNRAIRKFNKITGSIVILDEIQAFPHKFWLLFKEIAKKLTEHFNTYFILSTATQPAIFDEHKELLEERRKYFQSFKRTKLILNTSEPIIVDFLSEKVISKLKVDHKNTLIVLNTVSSAVELFHKVKKTLQDFGYEIYYLSSHVTPYERRERINKIKCNNSKKKCVVSTQLVEAGVDIDMEIVIRDMGPLDSINQVAGRSNRNWKKNIGEVEIIDLKDANDRFYYSYIYDAVLIDSSKRILRDHNEVSEDEFLELVEKYFKYLKQSISNDLSNKYLEEIKFLNYRGIGSFELIEEKGEKCDIFIELNEEAEKVWSEYQKIIKITDPFKSKSNFLMIRNKFYEFVISVNIHKTIDNLPPLVGGIRYISKTQLNEFYDSETGFKQVSNLFIW